MKFLNTQVLFTAFNDSRKGASTLLFILLMGLSMKSTATCTKGTMRTLTTNETWTTPTILTTDIDVPSGFTLQILTTTVDIYPNVSIFVEPGGHLVVENSILRPNNSLPCVTGGTWQGISGLGDLHIPGTLYNLSTHLPDPSGIPWIEITGSTINFAVCGVTANNYSIIDVEGNTFNDCQTSVQISGTGFDGFARFVYESKAKSADQIVNNNFQWSMLFPGTSDFSSSVMVSISDATYVDLGGNQFKNNYSSSILGYGSPANISNPMRGIGLQISNSQVLVHDQFMTTNANGCPIPDAGHMGGSNPTNFENLSFGVKANTSKAGNNHNFGIQHATFTHCTTGILLQDAAFSTIHNCSFTYSAAGASSFYNTSSGVVNEEIHLINSTSSIVANNTLSSDNPDLGTDFIVVDGRISLRGMGWFQDNILTWTGSHFPWGTHEVTGFTFSNNNELVVLECNVHVNLRNDWLIKTSGIMMTDMVSGANGWHNTWSAAGVPDENINNMGATAIKYYDGGSAPFHPNLVVNVSHVSPVAEVECTALDDCSQHWPFVIGDGINDPENQPFPVTVFPNPASGYVRIGYVMPMSHKNALITITDINGKTIKTIATYDGSQQADINTEDMHAGIYFYKVQVGNAIANGKMMIDK